jgi:hypothetical protein
VLDCPDVLPFGIASVALGVAQALCVALPAAGLPGWLGWARGRGWALVAPLSIAVVIGAIAVLPSSADVLTWVALFGVPLGCALALGWAAHRALPPLAGLAPALLAVVWVWPHELGGELARIALIAGSVVTIGRLLAGGTPLVLLKAGLVAMAVIDAILVFGHQLQQPNAVLVAASPGAGLPQLQAATLHGASLGYGDFFAAGVFGAVLAAEGRRQAPVALAVLVAGLAWDLLFYVVDTVPATVPVAVVLLVLELTRGATDHSSHPSSPAARPREGSRPAPAP